MYVHAVVTGRSNTLHLEAQIHPIKLWLRAHSMFVSVSVVPIRHACLPALFNQVAKCRTLDQARAVVTFLDAASEKTLRSTLALTASRGRGKSAALGLAIAGQGRTLLLFSCSYLSVPLCLSRLLAPLLYHMCHHTHRSGLGCWSIATCLSRLQSLMLCFENSLHVA